MKTVEELRSLSFNNSVPLGYLHQIKKARALADKGEESLEVYSASNDLSDLMQVAGYYKMYGLHTLVSEDEGHYSLTISWGQEEQPAQHIPWLLKELQQRVGQAKFLASPQGLLYHKAERAMYLSACQGQYTVIVDITEEELSRGVTGTMQLLNSLGYKNYINSAGTKLTVEWGQ